MTATTCRVSLSRQIPCRTHVSIRSESHSSRPGSDSRPDHPMVEARGAPRRWIPLRDDQVARGLAR